MKSVLIDSKGHVNDVVEPGQEFPVYQGPDAVCTWVTCQDDNVTSCWLMTNKTWLAPENRYENGQSVKRQIAYGEVGEQLDMMFKDQLNGTTHWKDHVSTVKSTIQSEAAFAADDRNRVGKTEVNLHDDSNPAWLHLPEGDNIISNIPTGVVYETE